MKRPPENRSHCSPHKPRQRQAALTVELALCLPILFVFLFGCYEVAHANMILHATESAAYEAARVGIIPGARQADIRRTAESVLSTVGIRDFEIRVVPDVITTRTEKVLVEISVGLQNNSAAPRLFLRNSILRGHCELSREVF